MRKIIEASIDKQGEKNEKDARRDKNSKTLASLAAISLLGRSSNKKERQKLLNDIMYYLRKLINLAKKVQNLSEGVETEHPTDEELSEFEKIKSEINELEELLKEKP